MRLGKTIVLIILLIFGYVMQCEMFQRYLTGVSPDECLLMDLSYSSNEEYDALISAIEELSQTYGVSPYAILLINKSDIECGINIYGNDVVRNALKTECGITNRTYKSLSSGTSNVQFYQFSELISTDENFTQIVYFIGEDARVDSVYEALSKEYRVSRPYEPGLFEEDMTYIIWITIDFILILMTVLFVTIKKKEIVIKISMGQDSKILILKDMIYEMAIDFFTLFFVRLACSLFLSGEYMEKECILVYLAGVVLSCMIYISYAVYDIKRAFSNAIVSKQVFIGTYILKFVVGVGTIFTIITNIELIMQNKMSIGSSEFIKEFSEYYYIDIVGTGIGECDENERYSLQNKIFVGKYEKFKPVVSTHVLNDNDTGANYVIVNEFGADTIKDFIKETEIQENTDVVIFVPKKYNTDYILSERDYCLSKIINNGEQLNKNIVVYNKDKTFWYVNRNLNNNMSAVENPIVIYACFSGSEHLDDLCIDDTKNVMYKIDGDVNELEEKYGLKERGWRIMLTKVSERFDYYNSYLKQGISFCSSIAIFMFLLQVILIVTVILMEYKNNALELSLKKIYGYGFVRRCRSFILKSVISGFAAIGIGVAVGVITGMYKVRDAVVTGAIMLIVELIMDMCFVLKNERENTIKVLKGGSL